MTGRYRLAMAEGVDRPGARGESSGSEVSSGSRRTAGRAAAVRSRANRWYERVQDRPLVDLVMQLYRRDRETAGSVLGSAIAFRLFLFFMPLLLFAVGVVGFLDDRIDEQQVEETTGISGRLAETIIDANAQAGTARWLATAVGFVGMIIAGRSLSRVMAAASCLAWQVPVQSRASVRLVGAIAGLTVGAALITVIVNRVRADLGLAVTTVSLLAAFLLYALGWMVISALLPRGTNDLSALIPGAVVMGAALAGMQAVSQLYLSEKIGRASALYGVLGAAVVTLGWFFILGRALVLSLLLDAVINERFGSIARFVFALPLLRSVARRSAFIRRLFDLDGASRAPP